MMINEPKSAERMLATSHSTNVISAACQTPPPAHAEATARLENAKPTTTVSTPPLSRKTKIIATLGPATESGEVLRNLLEAGVSVFRVNLASISREAAMKAVYAIRSISTDLQRPVSLLLDTPPSTGRPAGSPAISESDWADIRFGLECGVDWLAVSAGCDGGAMRQLRQFLTDQKRTNLNILARIESPSTLVALDGILPEADGVILGGGEPPAAELLRDWQLIVQKCVSARKLAVIATRANADVVAVLSAQPDAVLVAEETSVGANPLQSVQTLDGLIRQAESGERREAPASIVLVTEQDQTIAAAVRQAEETKAEAIVVFTRSGNSAALCAALRPRQSRVFAFTPDARLARRLRLRYALESIVLPFCAQPKATVVAAEKFLRGRKLIKSGAKIVFVTDLIEGDRRISSVQVRTLA